MVSETQQPEVNDDGPVLSQPAEADASAIAAPAEAPVEGEEGAPESEATARKSWDERKAEIDADEEYKSAYEQEKAAEYIRGIEAERVRSPEYQQSIQLSREVQGQIRKANTMAEGLTEALQNVVATRDPDLIAGVEDALRKDPRVADSIRLLVGAKAAESVALFFDNQPAPNMPTPGQRLAQLGIGQVDDNGRYKGDLNNLPDMVQANYFRIARGIVEDIAKEAGAPSILRDFDSSNEVVAKALSTAVKASIEHAKKQGLGLSNKRAAELEKGDARDVGPDTSAKGVGGGRPTPKQYADASYEQRQEWKKAGIEPSVS